MTNIKVIIPAYNEADSIALVINEIPNIVNEIIVVDNNSSDNTAEVAKQSGATVISQPLMGYGNACLKGMEYIDNQNIKPEIIVFLDGDFSDNPEELTKIVKPIIEDDIDFVIGARVKEFREDGAMMPQQIFGNWLATSLMRLFFAARYTDLGPFRAIKYEKLLDLKMEDTTYGWTVEMQLKAQRQRLSYIEVPVHYKKELAYQKYQER